MEVGAFLQQQLDECIAETDDASERAVVTAAFKYMHICLTRNGDVDITPKVVRKIDMLQSLLAAFIIHAQKPELLKEMEEVVFAKDKRRLQ